MEKEPLVNRFISVPRDKGSLNCAVFIAGIVEAVLCGTGFVCELQTVKKLFNISFQPAKVTAHWHKGTTYMVKFEESVIARDKHLEER